LFIVATLTANRKTLLPLTDPPTTLSKGALMKQSTKASAIFLPLLLGLLANSTTHLPAQQSPTLTENLIQVKSGVTLDYVEQGAANGPVIVLLHGAGDSWHSYERVLPLLPTNYHVYAITLRGHGLSDHPVSGYLRSDFAGDILDFLAQKKISHATLVGHSLGSYVAQTVAENDTGHIDRLVLIGSGPGPHNNPTSSDPTESIKNDFAALKDPVPYTFARDFQASTIYHPVPAAFFETMVGEAEKLSAATWHGLAQGLTNPEPLDNLKKIQIPTLLFWGEKDSIFSNADQQLLLKTIPHAELKAYPETGHALHWERPTEFTHDLLAFIEQK